MENNEFKNDHDLLIAVHENLKTVAKEVGKLGNKVDEFNNNYAKKADIDPQMRDHESRLRRLEWFGAIAVGMLYVIQFLSKYFHFNG